MVPMRATRDATKPTPPDAAGRGSPTFRLSVAATALVAVGLQLLQACTFGAPDALKTPQDLYTVLDAAPYVDDATVLGERWRVIDAPKLKVDHGYTCASAPRAASKEYIGSKLFDSATLPANFDGTILLNGWELQYEHSDHHVVGLGTVIFNIARSGNDLTWEAGGVLSDHRADDEYRWCYHYTILAWAKNVGPPIGGLPKPRIEMKAIHANANGKLVFVDQHLDSDDFQTKAASFKAPNKPRARLLAGFGVSFDDDDHHLLQFGFDLGASKIRQKKIKWTTDVILKDNSKRSFGVGELATVLTGESVHVWKPDAVLVEEGLDQSPVFIANDLRLGPADDSSVCLGGGDTRHNFKFKIEGVPFTYAVPMLTGWDVDNTCNDEHVKKIGAWIEDFTWERNPGDSTGTLTYNVRTILEDKKPDRGITAGMQVEVLGVNVLEPPGNG